jgi:hypothetical protein
MPLHNPNHPVFRTVKVAMKNVLAVMPSGVLNRSPLITLVLVKRRAYLVMPISQPILHPGTDVIAVIRNLLLTLC